MRLNLQASRLRFPYFPTKYMAKANKLGHVYQWVPSLRSVFILINLVELHFRTQNAFPASFRFKARPRFPMTAIATVIFLALAATCTTPIDLTSVRDMRNYLPRARKVIRPSSAAPPGYDTTVSSLTGEIARQLSCRPTFLKGAQFE